MSTRHFLTGAELEASELDALLERALELKRDPLGSAALAMLGTLAGVDVAVASPPGYALESDLALPCGARGRLTLHEDPREAVTGADAVYTDAWVSMGDEQSADERRIALAGYRLDDAL